MEINIADGFDCGCHRFTVISDSKEVSARDRHGECCLSLSEVRFAPKTTDEKLHETIIHEFIEAIGSIYCANKLEQEEIVTLANGLAQVFKSLGFMFTIEGRVS